MWINKLLLVFCILIVGCNNTTVTKNSNCRVDSLYKAPVLTIEDQISPTFVYITKCGNFYSMYNAYYKVGDSIQMKKQ